MLVGALSISKSQKKSFGCGMRWTEFNITTDNVGEFTVEDVKLINFGFRVWHLDNDFASSVLDIVDDEVGKLVASTCSEDSESQNSLQKNEFVDTK